jgi:hypothetical protein
MAENRTLQFLGLAYGNAPVLLNAHINGTVVFSGSVSAIDEPPYTGGGGPGIVLTQPLFTANTTLFPTDFSGAYPVTISVANGNVVFIGAVYSNYMLSQVSDTPAVMNNSTITDTTLTVGTLATGTIKIGQLLSGTDIVANTQITGGSESTWTVNNSQTVATTTIIGQSWTPIPGNATAFSACYVNQTPNNGTNPPDPRSNVTIDGIPQTRAAPTPETMGPNNWPINAGSTLAFDLTVSLGNVA